MDSKSLTLLGSMPRSNRDSRCAICKHPNVAEIEARIATPAIALRAISREFGVSRDSLQHHRGHMAAMLAAARGAGEIESIDTLYKRVVSRMKRAGELAEKAAEFGDFRGAAALLKVAQQHDEILCKLGEKPGFRATQNANNTTLNAPHARIVVAPSLNTIEGQKPETKLLPSPD